MWNELGVAAGGGEGLCQGRGTPGVGLVLCSPEQTAHQFCVAVELRGPALSPPKPTGSSVEQVAPEQKRVFSDLAQQLGVAKKALSLRVCLSGRLVAEKSLPEFLFKW